MRAQFGGIAAILALAPATAGCSLLGGTVLDTGTAESEITDYLNNRYASAGITVDSVSCDPGTNRPAPGATFTCDSRVRGTTVPVEVTVMDDDMRIRFAPTKKLYDLAALGPNIVAGVEKQIGRPVTVDCGTGFAAAAPGESFPCTVASEADPTDRLKIDYKVGPMTGEDRWESRDA
ncbi:hypothetical protein AXK56_11795 [Tsukamurella pulmonis]|uniref:DUF4333 domain-containing protein n=1 Tax=Tsukamurella pulmonis TaxID=47312 RepID=A0A1H1H4W2_9ACTN|nr:DUF4333 domain-containing protein [Tsukamurella pulmonis]KXO88061.1 hypothetical protein AXK56_11795 [Tsukamurella pulmonis]SDR20116.1 protein of unknown function [Tsukamurella pulmonis]SUP16015.1 Uncharacterised protein [Tsukamurella pulmonis]